jgi:hypothetical protein
MASESAESEELLAGEFEKFDQRTQKYRAWDRIKSNAWILQTNLILLVVVLLVERRWHDHVETDKYELTGDLTGFAPRCRLHHARTLW